MTMLSEPAISTRLRPITMAILAMGGEGGGVLADWTVALAESNDFYAQSTSVPGVAQRTGATVYYVELFPRELEGQQLPYPVLSTMPMPGEVDIVVASELMEAGRAVQRGFVTPDRTVLISSTSRTYSMPERTAMGDGRIDSTRIIEAAKAASLRFIRGDFSRAAEDTGSVISAVLFGAICGAGVLPFSREQFEDAIREGGKGVEASLRAFDQGFSLAIASERPTIDISIGTRPAEGPHRAESTADTEEMRLAVEDPASLVGSRLQEQAARIGRAFPADARHMLVHGVKRTAEYQDVRYADQYLDRVARIAALEGSGDGSNRLTLEAARYTALWMTYEDTIRVAFHKVRERRFSRVGTEARIKDDQIMQVHEYLHPQVEEISDTLPTRLGRWVLESALMNKIIYRFTNKGIKLQTTSLWGFTLLYFLARLRPIRRRSLRFSQEQSRIDTWLDSVVRYGANYDLAYEIVMCQQLIKGYGETHARGMANFTAIMDVLPKFADDPRAAARVARLRSEALADESGQRLAEALAAPDIA